MGPRVHAPPARGTPADYATGDTVVAAVLNLATVASGLWLVVSSFAIDLGSPVTAGGWDESVAGLALLVAGAWPLVEPSSTRVWAFATVPLGIWVMASQFPLTHHPGTTHALITIATGAVVLSLGISGVYLLRGHRRG